MDLEELHYDLIVTVVPKSSAEKALRASRAAGAEGGTILYGRGAGIHERRTILGVPIEPEKEILLTVVPKAMSDKVLGGIVDAVHLDAPATGIAFVVGLDKVAGICHQGSWPEEGRPAT